MYPGEPHYVFKKLQRRRKADADSKCPNGVPIALLFAIRAIKPDEEITVAYSTAFWENPQLACCVADPREDFPERISMTTEITASTGEPDVDKRLYSCYVLDYGLAEHGNNPIRYSFRQLWNADKRDLLVDFESSANPEFGASLRKMCAGNANPSISSVQAIWSQGTVPASAVHRSPLPHARLPTRGPLCSPPPTTSPPPDHPPSHLPPHSARLFPSATPSPSSCSSPPPPFPPPSSSP